MEVQIDMKKILSTILALTLVLSMSVPAYAEVTVNGETKGPSPVTYDGDAQSVKADGSGDKLTVNGSVAGDESANDAVFAADTAKITVSESVTKTGDNSGFAVKANSGSDVTVEKNITESGESDAIYTSNNSKVYVGGNVSESDDGYAIQAYFGSSVEVTGNVTESGEKDAIYATGSGTIITVEGNVTESDGGHAIEAKGSDTTVTVKGDVTENGDGNAIYAQEGAVVIVYGSVTENDNGVAINALSGSTVKVGGDVTGNGSDAAIMAANDATVIVEGEVEGDVAATGALYLGQLEGSIKVGQNNIHYLIGTAAEGSVALNAINLISDIVAAETIDGVTENGYKYTTTADKTALGGKTITLKPADGKILAVSGYDSANVSYVANADGTVTFTIGDEFNGGLQNLVLVITDKPSPSPTPTPDPQPTPSPSEPDPQPTTPVTSPVQYTETGNPVKNYVANNPTGSNVPLPYITTDGAKAGWQTIDEALDAHKANYKGKNVDALSVTMNGSATVDSQLIIDAHDKDIPLSFVLDDEVTVGIPTANSVLSDQAKEGKATYFKVSSMTTAEAVSVNKADAGLLPSDLVAIGGSENTPVVLTLCSNDKLSTDKSQLMTISFNASKAGYKKGDKVYLYCGTSLTGIAMYKMGTVGKDGFVTFSVPMVSNYWTIGSTNMGDKLFRNN